MTNNLMEMWKSHDFFEAENRQFLKAVDVFMAQASIHSRNDFQLEEEGVLTMLKMPCCRPVLSYCHR